MGQARTQLFRWGGGGMHFKLERTSCQQSLIKIYISVQYRRCTLFYLEKKYLFVYVRYVIS